MISPNIYIRSSKGVFPETFVSRNLANTRALSLRSPRLKGYYLFHPIDPYLLLSIIVAWKKHNANSIYFYFGSLSSIFSRGKNVHALFILFLSPEGGSFVSFMHLFKIPIGIFSDGSALK